MPGRAGYALALFGFKTMGYQSKTYSLSDEVVAAIEEKREAGVTPDRFLWSLIFQAKKPTRRDRLVAERAASDVVAQAVGRKDIDYSDIESTPTTHVGHLDAVGPSQGSRVGKASTQTFRRPMREKGSKL